MIVETGQAYKLHKIGDKFQIEVFDPIKNQFEMFGFKFHDRLTARSNALRIARKRGVKSASK